MCDAVHSSSLKQLQPQFVSTLGRDIACRPSKSQALSGILRATSSEGMGCLFSKKSTEHAVYVVETDVPDLMSGGALRNEYEVKRNYLDVYGKPPPEGSDNPAIENEGERHSSRHKRKKHHSSHEKENEDNEAEDFDADALIQVDGPHAVNEKQTHAHSTV